MSARFAFDGTSLPSGLAAGSRAEAPAPGGGVVLHVAPERAFTQAAVEQLRAARAPLASRPVGDIVATIGRAGARFLDPEDPLRKRAEAALPATSGLSAELARAVVEGMARDWTVERLDRLVRTDFEDPAVLDAFVATGTGSRLRAMSGDLAFHVAAGSVPGVGATSVLRSLLVKSPVFLKPGAGDVVLPVLLREAVAEEDPVLGDAVAVAYWPGGTGEAEEVLIAAADPVVVYGGLETVREMRRRVPPETRLVVYSDRVGVGVVGRGALSGEDEAGKVAIRVAEAAIAFDQRGCVSPHTVFVEAGGAVAMDRWAELVAEHLEALDALLPAGVPDPATAGAIHQLRGEAELMGIAAGERRLLRGGRGTGWTLIAGPVEGFPEPCGGRVLHLVPVPDALEVPERLTPLRGVLQTVAIAGLSDREDAFAEAMGAVGATRLCSFGEAPWPPGWWRHDGLDPLRVLTRWVEWTPTGG